MHREMRSCRSGQVAVRLAQAAGGAAIGLGLTSLVEWVWFQTEVDWGTRWWALVLGAGLSLAGGAILGRADAASERIGSTIGRAEPLAGGHSQTLGHATETAPDAHLSIHRLRSTQTAFLGDSAQG
jgi:hypothetical protein